MNRFGNFPNVLCKLQNQLQITISDEVLDGNLSSLKAHSIDRLVEFETQLLTTDTKVND